MKLASINLQKLVLSPTGSINLGFILREDLLLCLSYLPLGVSNWADIYMPSTAQRRPSVLPNITPSVLPGATSTAQCHPLYC
jgi:hypothetical protein